MVDVPTKSTLTSLARHRVMYPDDKSAARPFTVTEYNHAAPNDYQAEGIPMIASFAAAQDWDGIFLFAYRHSGDWNRDHVRSFFDIAANPVKMAQMAAGALMFRRGDIPALPASVVTALPPDRMAELAGRYGPWSDDIFKAPELNAPPVVQFFGRYAIAPFAMPGPEGSPTRLLQKAGQFELPKAANEDGPWSWSTADDVLRWTAKGPGSGIYTAHGRRSVAVVGFAAGKPQEVGPVRVDLKSPRFAAITLSSLDGKPLDKSSRILVTACARTENTDQKWNEARTSVTNQWGKAPTLIEPVRARLILNHAPGGKPRLIAIGGDGKPLKELPVEIADDGKWDINLPGDPATLWYVLTVE